MHNHLAHLIQQHYNIEITFEATAGRGRDQEIITATQVIASNYLHNLREVQVGDRVIIISNLNDEWHLMEYVRIYGIITLGAVFVVLMILFGRIKGFNAVLGLGLTCLAIFAVFIPSILSGRNIYASAIIVCIYSIVVTLFVVVGVNQKSVAAVAGCLGGMFSAAILTISMTRILGLTGIIDNESTFLLHMRYDDPISLTAIIFAGIIIGAVGALMDVSMSISSALWELKAQTSELTFAEYFKSGINIGKDVMGTMANTLVLAYIGSSLTVILLLVTFSGSFAELINREMIIVELLKAIIGSIGIMLTMPLTALICAGLYSRDKEYLNDFY